MPVCTSSPFLALVATAPPAEIYARWTLQRSQHQPFTDVLQVPQPSRSYSSSAASCVTHPTHPTHPHNASPATWKQPSALPHAPRAQPAAQQKARINPATQSRSVRTTPQTTAPGLSATFSQNLSGLPPASHAGCTAHPSLPHQLREAAQQQAQEQAQVSGRSGWRCRTSVPLSPTVRLTTSPSICEIHHRHAHAHTHPTFDRQQPHTRRDGGNNAVSP